ncbi:MAG: cyanoexosortase A system-associated protein [Cyanobacteria bacterium J06641_5]
MAENSWPQQMRMGLLAAVLGSTAFVTGRVVLQPEVARQKAPASTLEFPAAIDVKDWQLQGVQPWEKAVEPETEPDATAPAIEPNAEPDKRPPPPPGIQYSYRRPDGSGTLEARARFLPRAGNGNTSRLLQTYTSAQPASVRIAETYREGVGFYGFFIFENEASIMACITPHGGTTVTGQQFSQTTTFQIGRALPWLLGQQDLLDRRCLFGIVSVPARQGEIALTNYPNLEAAWLDWVDHWQQAF